MKYSTFSDLTVGQAQELYKIRSEEGDEIGKGVACVSILTGLPRWQVEEMPLPEFNTVSSELAIIFSPQHEPGKPKVVIDNKYKIQVDPRKLSAGQYIDVQTFLMQGDWIAVMDKIIASISVNKKGEYEGNNHASIAERVKEMKFKDVYSTCVFFLKLWKASTKVLADYLKKELKKNRVTLTPEQIKTLEGMDFMSVMDGYTTP